MEKFQLLDQVFQKKEMTVQGRSQGKGYAPAESRVPALTLQLQISRGHSAVVRSCPCCEQEPREPVFLDGQLVCRSCTSACAVCSSSCLPGAEVCDECAQHLYPAAVGA